MINGKTVLCEIGVGPVSMAYGALVWNNPAVEVIMFEPHPVFYADLIKAMGDRKNVTIHNVAIGDENGISFFHNEGTSSALVGTASPIQQHKGDNFRVGIEGFQVEVRKLSEFDRGEIDILRVDTEGSEWFALKHLVSRPKEIVVEIYNDLATYINPHLYEIEHWCKQNGYKKVGIHDGDFTYRL